MAEAAKRDISSAEFLNGDEIKKKKLKTGAGALASSVGGTTDNTGGFDPLQNPEPLTQPESDPKEVKSKPKDRHRRRNSIAESPSVLKEVISFTPEPLDVDLTSDDDGFGVVSPGGLEDPGEMQPCDQIILRAGGTEVVVPREASSIIGLLETALEADSTLSHLDCSKASPWILSTAKTYVDWRLENEVQPITIQVNAPVGDLLISDQFELKLLSEFSAEKLFELTFSAEYLQIDAMLDTIYKYLVIILSNGTQDQIRHFLQTGEWHQEFSLDMDEQNIMAPESDDEIMALDAEEDFEPEMKAKILLQPVLNASDDDPKAKASKHKYTSGKIATVISQLERGEITLFPGFQSLPRHCWSKVAEYSCVNRNFCVTRKQASLSKLLVNIGLENARSIRVRNVDAETLNCVCKYLRHHDGKQPAEIAKPIRSVKMEKICEDPWDAKFINGYSKKFIFQLTLAANYMDMTSLLHLCCAKVATMIKGKSPEEIRQILGEEEENANTQNEAANEENAEAANEEIVEAVDEENVEPANEPENAEAANNDSGEEAANEENVEPANEPENAEAANENVATANEEENVENFQVGAANEENAGGGAKIDC